MPPINFWLVSSADSRLKWRKCCFFWLYRYSMSRQKNICIWEPWEIGVWWNRARYTYAGMATGRSGRVAVLVCFNSSFWFLFFVFLLLLLVPSSFHLYPGISRTLPLSLSLSSTLPFVLSNFFSFLLLLRLILLLPRGCTYSRRVVVRLFYYFYKRRRRHHWVPGASLCWSTKSIRDQQ